MGILTYKNAVAGEPSNDGLGVDQYFNDMAVVTTDLDEANTRTEWVSTKHIDWDNEPLSKAYVRRASDDGTQLNYNNVAWAAVSHGPNGSTQMEGLGIPIVAGHVMRFHFSCMTPQQSGIGLRDEDYVWFKIQWKDGGGVWNDVGYQARYTTTHKRAAGLGDYPRLGNRRIALSFIEIPTIGGLLDGVRVMFKVENVANFVRIKDWQFDISVKRG